MISPTTSFLSNNSFTPHKTKPHKTKTERQEQPELITVWRRKRRKPLGWSGGFGDRRWRWWRRLLRSGARRLDAAARRNSRLGRSARTWYQRWGCGRRRRRSGRGARGLDQDNRSGGGRA